MKNSNLTNTLETGYSLRNYIIFSVLGRGAFGITYLAHDQRLKRFVAIKEYFPQELVTRESGKNIEPFFEDEEKYQYGLNSFLLEAQTLAKFRHPNIVHIAGLFKENNTAYIVMEYEKGETFKDYIENGGDVSQQRLIEIFYPIHHGLRLVHSKGYIHRDIKPDNIMIREDNTPVLIDFGTAREILNSNSEYLTRVLTEGYAPVEQYNPKSAKQGPWTDIYALGATLYFAITGKNIEGADKRKENESYLPLSSLYAGKYHPCFLQAIDSSLLIEPDKRPQSLEKWNELLITISCEKIKKDLSNRTTIRMPPPALPNKKTSKNKYILPLFLFGFVAISASFYLYSIEYGRTISSNSINDYPMYTAKLKLKNPSLTFKESKEIHSNLNKYISSNFNLKLRAIYLKSLDKTLTFIPNKSLMKEHKDWIRNRGNSIYKDKEGIYKIRVDFKKELSENKHLFGTLRIENNNDDFIKVKIKSENYSFPINIKKIQSGEVKLEITKKKGGTITRIIAIHPNQNFYLVIN